MTRLLLGTSLLIAFSLGTGCKRGAEEKRPSKSPLHDDHAHQEGDHGGHDHDGGDQHDHAGHAPDDVHEHGHDKETPLGSVMIAGMKVALAQGHGRVEAGKEGHLVVKLPYNDAGATVVRAWIGTNDRAASFVGRGEYAAPHDDYDVHAIAPDPLPQNVMWWVEIQKPDGKKRVGSVKPLLD